MSYKCLGRFVHAQIEKFAQNKDLAVQESAAKGVDAAGNTITQGSAPASAFDLGKFAGVFAAIGLAVGAIGTALATIVSSILKLQPWQMPLVCVGALIEISATSVIIAR